MRANTTYNHQSDPAEPSSRRSKGAQAADNARIRPGDHITWKLRRFVRDGVMYPLVKTPWDAASFAKEKHGRSARRGGRLAAMVASTA